MRLLRPYNPLVFPGNRLPGFDPSHPAAVNCRLSAIPTSGGNFVNLLKGSQGTKSSGITLTVQGLTGFGANDSGQNNDAVTFTGQPTTNDVVATVGAFITITGTVGANKAWFANSTGNAGFALSLFASTDLRVIFSGGGNAADAGFPAGTIASGNSYFVVMSFSQSGSNFLLNAGVLNLRTGKIYTSFSSVASTGPITPSGTYRILNGPGFFDFPGIVSAISFSAVFLTVSQIFDWASDPWSFWYPPNLPNLVFSSLGFQGSSTPPRSMSLRFT